MNTRRRTFLFLAGTTLAMAVLPFSVRGQDKLKIGIIGSGKVGSAIGAVWVNAGHEVMFSSRDIEHDRALAERLGGGAKAGTPREAAAFGDVVVVSVPYGALPEVGKSVADLIEGKVVIDTCNPFPNRDGDIANWAIEIGTGNASAELLAGARVVRAYNAIGAARMGAQYKDPGVVGMPIAGDDDEAVAVAAELVRETGYVPVPVGDRVMGGYLRPGTPLAGEHSPEEIREIAAGLE